MTNEPDEEESRVSEAAAKALFDGLCKPPTSENSWASDWRYETDFLLSHVSGLKVAFEDSGFNAMAQSDNAANRRASRSNSLGDFVAGSVMQSQNYMRRQGLNELYAMRSTTRLFGQATKLFRNYPAGIPGAPPRMTKLERLLELAQKRKAKPWDGYRGICEFHDGKYECDHVSPVTRTAGNLESDVFLLLQDWSSADSLMGKFDPEVQEIGYTSGELTFRTLSELLRDHFHLELDEVYATNLFPFIKPGGMTRKIRSRDLVRAAREFAIPQIKIVRPRLVICIGLEVFKALQRATGERPIAKNLTDAASSPMHIAGATVWSQAHTGYYGQMTRNREDPKRVDRDWARMAEAFLSNKPT